MVRTNTLAYYNEVTIAVIKVFKLSSPVFSFLSSLKIDQKVSVEKVLAQLHYKGSGQTFS
jgi:hypothetical protein